MGITMGRNINLAVLADALAAKLSASLGIVVSESEPEAEKEGVLWYQPSVNALRIYVLE